MEVNGSASHTTGLGESTGLGMPLLELPGLAMSAAFRGVSQQHAIRVKETCERMKAASDELTAVVRKAYVGGTEGAASYGGKLIDISSANTASAFDFLCRLMDARSVPEVMELSAAHARKTFATVLSQNHELWNVAQQAAAGTVAPVKSDVPEVLPTS